MRLEKNSYYVLGFFLQNKILHSQVYDHPEKRLRTDMQYLIFFFNIRENIEIEKLTLYFTVYTPV